MNDISTTPIPSSTLRAVTGSVCFLDCGGPTLKISVNGAIVTFEYHPYCGPTKLNKRGDPASDQPMAFLKAAVLWAKQGRQVAKGLCVWNHEQEPILRQINRRSACVIGWKPARKGE
jgi:hypothetical protein